MCLFVFSLNARRLSCKVLRLQETNSAYQQILPSVLSSILICMILGLRETNPVYQQILQAVSSSSLIRLVLRLQETNPAYQQILQTELLGIPPPGPGDMMGGMGGSSGFPGSHPGSFRSPHKRVFRFSSGDQ